MQSHRNLLHNVWKLTPALGIGPEDRLTLLSSPSFGAVGVRHLRRAPERRVGLPARPLGRRAAEPPEFLEREGVTIYHSVPSVFRTFSSTLDGREDLSKLRVVKLGGEPVLASDFDLFRNRFPRTCRFHVGLGATEMHVIRHGPRATTRRGRGTPLGYAVDGTEVVLLGENGARRPTKARSASSPRHSPSATGRTPR